MKGRAGPRGEGSGYRGLQCLVSLGLHFHYQSAKVMVCALVSRDILSSFKQQKLILESGDHRHKQVSVRLKLEKAQEKFVPGDSWLSLE